MTRATLTIKVNNETKTFDFTKSSRFVIYYGVVVGLVIGKVFAMIFGGSIRFVSLDVQR